MKTLRAIWNFLLQPVTIFNSKKPLLSQCQADVWMGENYYIYVPHRTCDACGFKHSKDSQPKICFRRASDPWFGAPKVDKGVYFSWLEVRCFCCGAVRICRPKFIKEGII